MILYHGSNEEVTRPRLMPMARALDFGQGFYLTSDFEQAAKWARTTVLRRECGEATVSVFEIEDAKFLELKRMAFDGPTAEWLRFVTRNRIHRIDDSGCDVVSGPVANDNTMPVLNLYFKGAYSEEDAIKRLLTQKLRDQFAFKTEVALSGLKFVKAVKV